MQTDIKILGGLPVTIEFEIDAPDRSVGYNGGLSEWSIVAINGRPCKNPQWLYDRIEKRGDEEFIVEKCFDAYDNADDFSDYDID